MAGHRICGDELKSNEPGYAMHGEGDSRVVMVMKQPEEAHAPGYQLDDSAVTINKGYYQYIMDEIRHPTFVQSILAEWWATALFLFFLVISVYPGTNNGGLEILRIAFVAGMTIFALVYCFYGVSGGNINPAVSLGLAMSGRMTPPRAFFYMLAQMVGAITGCAMAKAVSPQAFEVVGGGANGLATLMVSVKDGITPVTITPAQGIFVEVMGTMLLVLTVLFCTDTARSIDYPHMTALIPLVIGLVVFIDHVALIPLTGTSVNPARSFGSAVMANKWDHHYVFWVGPMVGGAMAAIVYRLIFMPTDAFNALWGPDGIWAKPAEVARRFSRDSDDSKRSGTC